MIRNLSVRPALSAALAPALGAILLLGHGVAPAAHGPVPAAAGAAPAEVPASGPGNISWG